MVTDEEQEIRKKEKREEELRHWFYLKAVEGTLENSNFSYFFIDYFGIDVSYYRGKKILDIGCGPRGTLEWAYMAQERVGIDPFVEDYRVFDIEDHQMQYVEGVGEDIPFPNDHFDVVSIFNTLPHVDDPQAVIHQATRVLKPDGFLLLITNIDNEVGDAFSLALSWDVVGMFNALKLLDLRHFEFDTGLYESVRIGWLFDHSDQTKRSGVLTAKFQKV
jgi:ubiquinone/menaquinone biosynthesis C-methylase UbiE